MFDRYRRGIFNKYLRTYSLTDVLTKDLAHLRYRLSYMLRGNYKRMLCHPHYPSRGSTIFRICRHLGIEITNKVNGRFDAAIFWEYNTIKSEWKVSETSNAWVKLNIKSRDISKYRVDEVMCSTFNYGAAVDPTVYVGMAVEKSNTNATHDGRMVQCPCQPRQNHFYMILIDSSVSGDEVMDLRVPIIGDVIPHLYRAYRKKDARFVNVPPRVEMDTHVDQWLSQDERLKLIAFSRAMGLDYCELDTLRDCHSGLLYVVDANDTPQGPPRHLSPAEKKSAVASLARAFAEQFLN